MEFAIRGFTKASGVDMILEHHLLKNNIDSNEYILAGSGYLDSAGAIDSDLRWSSFEMTYPALGISGRFADLDSRANGRRAVLNGQMCEQFANEAATSERSSGG